jgi:hypothetical protein
MNQITKFNYQTLNYLHYLLFFLITFIFFAFFADYIFFYQEKSSLFIFSSDYLMECFHQPGSSVVYLGKLLSTFYFIPVAGSAIVSLIICLVIFFTSKILSVITGNHRKYLSLIAGGIMFYLHTNYHFQLFNSIGILLQLIFFFIIVKHLRGWLPVLISPVIYLLTGGFAWLLFLIYAIYLISNDFRKASQKIISLIGLNLLVILILKDFVLFQTFKTLIIYPLSNDNLKYQLLFFLPLGLLIILAFSYGKIKSGILSCIRIPENIISLLPFILTIVLVMTIAWIRFDDRTRIYFQAEKLFLQNNFEELIEFNKKNPSTNILTSYLNNIALCEKGVLNDQLFHFLQKSDGQTLFLKWEMNEEVLRRGSYFYYTIGMINEAHRWAFENMVMRGFAPEDLIMLIKTELIKGNYLMASKYIRILKKTIFYRKKARGFEALLFNDDAVNSHPELGLKRKTSVLKDFFVITDDPISNIDKLLTQDSTNHNAYQYRLAYMLIRKDYKRIVAELPKLGNHGFKSMPEHLEEAVIVYKTLNLGPLPNTDGIHFNPKTELRFKQYLQTLSYYKNDLKAAEPILKQKFGTTFWYWALFR